MIPFIMFASILVAQQVDWIAAGNRELDKGSPEEAAADFSRALDAKVQAGDAPDHVLHLRITLATAYLEAGEYRRMEAVLQDAQKTAWQLPDGASRAELLNAWSALHMKLGQLPAAEAELREARRIVSNLANSGDLRPTVLHNLAAVEMRTGHYTEALGDERGALQLFEKQLAPDHPTIIRGWASMASLEYMMGQPGEARESIERAIASAEKTDGSRHALLADLLESDAVILDKLKLTKEARAARNRARKMRGRGAAALSQDLTLSALAPMPPDVHLQSK